MSFYLVRSGFGVSVSTEDLEHSSCGMHGKYLGNCHVVAFRFGSGVNQNSDDASVIDLDPIALSKKVFPNILVVLDTAPEKLKGYCKGRFYQAGKEVLRCGSGYLAAAAVLENQIGSKKPYCLETAWETVIVQKVDQNLAGSEFFEFQFPINDLNIQRSSLSWRAYLNKEVRHQFSVGGENDYQVLELASEKAVKACQINWQLLRSFIQRSLIITAPSNKAKYDYCMRYFSPRYSHIEDNATGSANAVLAKYWQHRLQKKSVKVRQLSPLGGEYSVRRAGLSQKVSGRARIVRELRLEDIVK